MGFEHLSEMCVLMFFLNSDNSTFSFSFFFCCQIRFLCKDTIEEKILGLQTSKLSLAKAVLTG